MQPYDQWPSPLDYALEPTSMRECLTALQLSLDHTSQWWPGSTEQNLMSTYNIGKDRAYRRWGNMATAQTLFCWAW